MKAHTKGFKTQIALAGRELDDKITYTLNGKNVTLTSEDLNSVIPNYEGNILKSVMKEIDIDSNVSIPLDTVINYKLGVKVGNSYEYLDFGNYIVYSCDKSEDTNSYNIIAYDKLLYSMKNNEDLGVTYPITIRNYIKALCDKIGLTFANENSVFVNCNKTIDKELYLGLEYTYRDILDELAQVTASTICINSNDELEIRYITETNDVIYEEFFQDVNVQFGEKYGPVNSIVLSRSAGSDNIYLKDDNSVALNGLCEIKIEDNQIMNWDNRDEFLPEILEKLKGLEFFINDFSLYGVCYYDLCDRYSAKIGDKTYSCVMLNDEVNRNDGLEEIVFTEPLNESVTDYSKADKTDRRINKTILEVDKQNQTIKGIIENVDGNNKKLSKLEMDLDNISTTVSKTEETVNATVEKFRVNLETNTIIIPVNNSNSPHTTTNYDIKYEVYFMGQKINLQPITEDAHTGITVSKTNDYIRFAVNKNTPISVLDNKYTFKFSYTDTDKNTYELYKSIIVCLALQGNDGVDGVNGKSAYDLWLEEGNTGTYEDFMNSLKQKLIAEVEGTTLELIEKPNPSYNPIEFKVYGKTIQNGTSDVESPAEIKSIDNLEIKTIGKNICPSQFESWEAGQYSNANGEKTASKGRVRLKELIRVMPNEKYYYNFFNTTGLDYSIIIREYDINQKFVKSTGIVQSGAIAQTSSSTYYISVTIGDMNATTLVSTYEQYFVEDKIKPFICIDREVNKNFEDYKGLLYSIDLKNNELNKVEEASDVLIIKDKSATIDKYTNSFIFDGAQTMTIEKSVDVENVLIAFYNVLEKTGRANDINFFCNRLDPKIIWNLDETGIYINNKAVVMRLPKSVVGSTKIEINTWLSQNPIKIVYRLAESYSIELNDVDIKFLEGNNAITNNANTEMYIKYWTEVKGNVGAQGIDGKDSAIQSDVEPEDKTLMWLDTTTNQLKRYNGETWEVVNDFSHEIDSINSSINDLDASIQDKLHALENEVNRVITEFETKYTQTNNSFAWEINETLKTIKDKTGELEEKVIEQSEYMKFEAGVGLVIGKSTSPYTLVSKDDGIEIRYNNVPISFWNGDTFKVTRLMLGNFAFTPRNNGSLDFGKVVN